MFAVHVLNTLYQPLVAPEVAQKLYIAAATAVIKPQNVRVTDEKSSRHSGTLEAAQYIARIAVNELNPVEDGGKSKRGNLFTLFKGIIKTLQEIAQYDQVWPLCTYAPSYRALQGHPCPCHQLPACSHSCAACPTAILDNLGFLPRTYMRILSCISALAPPGAVELCTQELMSCRHATSLQRRWARLLVLR